MDEQKSGEYAGATQWSIDEDGVRFHSFIAPGFLITFTLHPPDMDVLCAEWLKRKQSEQEKEVLP